MKLEPNLRAQRGHRDHTQFALTERAKTSQSDQLSDKTGVVVFVFEELHSYVCICCTAGIFDPYI